MSLMFSITSGLCVMLGLWMFHHIARANAAEKRRDELESLFDTFWTHEAVLAVLKRLANEYHDAAGKITELQGLEPDALTELTEGVHDELAKSKKRFWDALSLAMNHWQDGWPDMPESHHELVDQ